MYDEVGARRMLREIQRSLMMVCRSAVEGYGRFHRSMPSGQFFPDLWKDSATLWHRDDFLPICNVYFQPDIVNPVRKYQLLVKLHT